MNSLLNHATFELWAGLDFCQTWD